MKKGKLTPYLLVSPYIVHFLLFVVFPVTFSILLTFFKWDIISEMKFTGFTNYRRLFADRLFWKALVNTLYFLSIHIPLELVVSLFLAEILNQKLKFQGLFRALFFLPVIVSGVAVTILWQQLYGYNAGLLNKFLMYIGLGKVGWLIDTKMAMPSIAIMATWKNVGLYIILFLVGLQTVPKQYYEAAELEGASHWQKFFKITLPLINPTIIMVVILSTIGGFSLFIEPYIMTGGGPLNSTLSALLYIYKQGFFYYHMGYASALGIFFAILIMAVVIIQRKYIEKRA
jgi:multiple sugar transport system permease protein